MSGYQSFLLLVALLVLPPVWLTCYAIYVAIQEGRIRK